MYVQKSAVRVCSLPWRVVALTACWVSGAVVLWQAQVTRADFKAFVTRCRAAQEAAGRQVHAAGAADGAAAAAMTVCPYSDCEIVDMLLGPLCAVVGRRAWTVSGTVIECFALHTPPQS
jgi:hypothetical protein